MNIEKLQQLPWYVKPFLRIFGILLWMSVTLTIGSIIVLLYIPFAILFGWSWSEKMMERGAKMTTIADDLIFI